MSDVPRRPVLAVDWGDNSWLYAWGDLPTNLHDLKQWLEDHDMTAEEFKNTAQYEANYDRFEWLKEL